MGFPVGCAAMEAQGLLLAGDFTHQGCDSTAASFMVLKESFLHNEEQQATQSWQGGISAVLVLVQR